MFCPLPLLTRCLSCAPHWSVLSVKLREFNKRFVQSQKIEAKLMHPKPPHRLKISELLIMAIGWVNALSSGVC